MSTKTNLPQLIQAMCMIDLFSIIDMNDKMITRIPGGFQLDTLSLDPRVIGIKNIRSSIFIPYTAVQEDPLTTMYLSEILDSQKHVDPTKSTLIVQP